jgi:predicted acylesterase/phospholipase RssA
VNRRITKEMWAAVPVAETKRASLALQGGGAHGAFTWGVLDRLLEEPNFQIDGVAPPAPAR